MARTITFNELRRIKDSLPHGTIQKIADDLGIEADAVRNYFGGDHFDESGKCIGLHIESGPEGGIVQLDDTAILDKALAYLKEA